MRKFSGARGAPTFRAPAGATRWGERQRVGEERERESKRASGGREAYRAETNDGQQNTATRGTRLRETCGSLCEQLNRKSSAALLIAARRADRVSRLKRLLEGDGVSLARNYVQADRNERSEARRDTNAFRTVTC